MDQKIIFLVKQALREDIPEVDVTSRAIFGKKGEHATANILAKQNLVVSGLDVAACVFKTMSQKTKISFSRRNGDVVKKGSVLAKISGNISDILASERVALNFLQHLSGVATLTNHFVEKVKPYRVRILDTRKTTPGLRLLEKRAVVHGGGFNHRMSLSDMHLIKDNHIFACGDLQLAVKKIQDYEKKNSKGKKRLIEVEADYLPQVREAFEAGADIVLLDNMTLAQIRKAVTLVKGQCLLEVSGGVNLKNVRKFAATGVSRISIGALTHSAPAVDISLEIS